MIWYEIVYGNHGNDYENYGDYKSLAKAMGDAKKLAPKYPYVRVDKFAGQEIEPGSFDGDYVDTVYEQGGSL